jgi:competence protein ComEC
VLIFLVWSLNSVIHFIEQLPFSTIRGIFISAPEMILLYVMIAAIFLFITLRRISFLYLFILATIAFELLFLDAKVQRLQLSRLTIFNSSREALYMFTTQDKAVLLYNAMTRYGGILQGPNHDMALNAMNAFGIKYHRDFWLSTRGRPPEIARSFVPVVRSGNFIRFADCRIAMLNRSVPKGFKQRLRVDLLIITDNPKINIEEVMNTFNPAQIIIDATNSRYKTRQWLMDAAKLGAHCHAVTEHGAFQKEF